MYLSPRATSIRAFVSGLPRRALKRLSRLGKLTKRRNKSRLPLFIGLFLLVALIPTFIWLLRSPSPTHAWFHDAWAYRRLVRVENQAGMELTDYPVSFTLDTAALIAAKKLRSDCADLRLADATATPLAFWVEETGANRCHTATTRIWVKLPVLPTTGALIYVYYGHTAAASLSSGSDVFDFFDSFSTLNPSVWQTAGEPIATASALALQAGATLVSQNPVLTDGVGRLITAFKQASLTLAGAKIGFSNTPSPTDHSHTDQAATIILGSTAETLAAYGGNNLISHHELEETTTTQAHQFKASGFFDTGKLNQALSIYGNEAGTEGSVLTIPLGNQISGKNYDTWNPNQGTVSFWVKPDWNGNDGKHHFLFSRYYYGYDLQIVKNSSNHLFAYFRYSNNTVHGIFVNASSWTAGNWYHIVVRWNAHTPITGSNYAEMYINNSLGGSYTSGWDPPTPLTRSVIGARGFSNGNWVADHQAQALIDDFIILDRVLSTTEITALYNSGTGQEAGIVSDPALKFYAKLDGSRTLSPVTTNLVASWDHNINLMADGDMELADLAAWDDYNSPTLKEKITGADVGFDTRSLRLITGGTAGIEQTLNVTPGQSYLLSFWILRGGPVTIRAYPTNAQGIDIIGCVNVSGPTNWTRVECVFTPNSSTTTIRFTTSSSGGEYLIDNVSVVPSLVANGGMEGEYVNGTAPGWTCQSQCAEEATIKKSGTKAQKITSEGLGINQGFSTTIGQWYVASAWIRLDEAGPTVSFNVGPSSTGDYLARQTYISSTSFTRYSLVFKATSEITYISSHRFNGSAVWYLDDVAVVPLKNVSGSFQAWSPVTDSVGDNNNPFSVHGAVDGVTSTQGIKGNAYLFDGSTGYLRQKTYALNNSNIAYSGNAFTDSGRNFEVYKSTSPAKYMLVVTNSDNTISWGYLGTGGNNPTVNVFTNRSLTTAGWASSGTSPTGKTPVGYEIRKADYNLSTGAITMGAWIRTNSSKGYQTIFSKYNGNVWVGPLLVLNNSQLRYSDGGSYNLDSNFNGLKDGNWHFVAYYPSPCR
jgi:hypothetical protein